MADEKTVEKRPINSTAVTRGDSPYNTSMLRYPFDVSVDPAKQSYTIFYINVPEGTNTTLGTEKVVGYINNTGANNVDSANVSQTAIAGLGAAVGVASSLSALKKINGLGGNSGLKGSAITALAGGLSGAVLASVAFPKSQYQRISDAIVLGLTTVPTVQYSATYLDSELGVVGGFLAGGSSAADASAANIAVDGIKTLARSAIKIPGTASSIKSKTEAFGGLNAESTIGSITKEVQNNYREQLFESVSFRVFEFNYIFMPVSFAEVEMVHKIIEKFKFHMHPDKSKTGLFFKFPSQFDIVHYYAGEENKFLNTVSTCVLEVCTVDYGAYGEKFMTFSEGAPIEIHMQLRFKEIELLTKQSIKDQGR
jgi:hypothetical protein